MSTTFFRVRKHFFLCEGVKIAEDAVILPANWNLFKMVDSKTDS